MLTAVLEAAVNMRLRDLTLSDFDRVVADYHLENDPDVKKVLPKDTDVQARERVRATMEAMKSRKSGYRGIGAKTGEE